jgi:phosphate acetyltransferase
MFEKMIALLKAKQRKLVFTEGTDPRIPKGAHRLYQEKILQPILLGNSGEVRAALKKCGFPVSGMGIIDPLDYPDIEDMVVLMAELRKDKMDEAACRSALLQSNYFGTMLVRFDRQTAHRIQKRRTVLLPTE